MLACGARGSAAAVRRLFEMATTATFAFRRLSLAVSR
jgi:hypothetical protein